MHVINHRQHDKSLANSSRSHALVNVRLYDTTNLNSAVTNLTRLINRNYGVKREWMASAIYDMRHANRARE